MQRRCKHNANTIQQPMQKTIHILCKDDAKKMQTQCKHNANTKQIQCKDDAKTKPIRCNDDANTKQILITSKFISLTTSRNCLHHIFDSPVHDSTESFLQCKKTSFFVKVVFFSRSSPLNTQNQKTRLFRGDTLLLTAVCM